MFKSGLIRHHHEHVNLGDCQESGEFPRKKSDKQPNDHGNSNHKHQEHHIRDPRSIIVTPQLLFLDEPTTGLDPRSRNQVWDIVRALAGGGTTILLYTQYLDEADVPSVLWSYVSRLGRPR